MIVSVSRAVTAEVTARCSGRSALCTTPFQPRGSAIRETMCARSAPKPSPTPYSMSGSQRSSTSVMTSVGAEMPSVRKFSCPQQTVAP